MNQKRKTERFIRRLETEFSAEDKNYRGISSDFSVNGLFIRTNHAFRPDTILAITVHLPDGNATRLKGRVRRAMKTPMVSVKNGMGVEIIEKDSYYENFMKLFFKEEDVSLAGPGETVRSAPDKASEPAESDFLIIPCPNCGVKNKVSRARPFSSVKCGKCSTPLQPAQPESKSAPEPAESDFLIIPCPNCGAKNKVRTSTPISSVRCGKCSALLQTY